MKLRTTSLLLAGLTAGFAAYAAEPAPQAEATGTFNGVTVAIDPATGRLRAPTAAEQAALRKAAPRAGARMSIAKPGPKTRAEAARTVRRHRNGMTSAHVSEDMMSHVIATQQADGTIRIDHADADGHVAPATQQEGAARE